MWLLKDKNGKIRYLKPGKTYNVGRKQADIVLDNDSSISRAHATILSTLKEQTRTSDVSSTCIVKDASSKYGVFIIRNDVQMKVPVQGLELEPGDTVKFGLQQHSFVVEYIRFVSVISRLSLEHKKQLKDIMDSIGGIVIDCFDDNCTHLTATTATSTSKMISALIAGLPIVDVKYWISVLNAINADQSLPDPNSFTLTLQDKGINSQRVSLKPNPVRKTLFQGKTFIFFSEKTYREYKKMIKDAGGKIELFKIHPQIDLEQFLTDDTIVMQITADNTTEEYATFDEMLYNKMLKQKLRMIAETEIPLAIVYVSLNQYCNPKFNFKELIQRKSFKDTSEVLALDTQDVLTSNPNTSIMQNILIPETQEFTLDNKLEKINNQATSIPDCSNEEPKELKNTIRDENLPKSTSTTSEKYEIEVEGNCSKDLQFQDEKTLNEKASRNLEIKETKPIVQVPSDDDFVETEKQKKVMKRKEDISDRKENKLSKLGFKRSEKKTLDFDLDDMDVEEPKEKVKKEIPTHDTNKEIKYNVKMNNNKLFKKVYKNIPVTRIALSDMTEWRPNV